jgi:hypothetical protein
MTAVPIPGRTAPPWTPALRRAGFGFAFWLAFLLMLEPGNLLRAAHLGLAFRWPSEILRIACAALLGAAASPAVFWLSRRLPVRSPTPFRNGVSLLGCLATLALALILAGALAAARLPPSSIRGGVGEQVVGNILLLTAALTALAAIAQAGAKPVERPLDSRGAKPFAVKRRGETLLLDPGSIDWIEAQGNYLALHAGANTHLARGVLGVMERELEPHGFVRVHRSALVNFARIRRLKALANGDAWLELDGGGRVRASRTYSPRLKAMLPP